MAHNDTKRPNILFILSDDQGPWAMSCAGTPELRTPNLDRLATSGIRFENFFCASPVCSPARATILTGQMPSQHGVQDFLRGGNAVELSNDGRVVRYLAGRTAYTEILAANGYACGLSGKWHLGDSATPQAGFDYWNVHATGGAKYYGAPMFQDGELYSADGYFSDVITDNAIGYMESRLGSGTPFSMNVHFTAPHAPWGAEQHPAEIYDDYFHNCAFDSVRWDPVHPNHLAKTGSAGSVATNPEERRQLLSGYFAAVTRMDTNIGRLIDWLEENGLRENTLIVFTADNGMNMGHHGIWGKGNGTYPPNMYDTSVKVPTMMSRPGHVPQGVVESSLLSHYDIMPTLLDYVGLNGPILGAGERPGKSFSSILHGEPTGADRPVVVLDEYGPTRMIRTDSLKYVHRYPDGPYELYDLVNDPEETKNAFDNPKFSDAIVAMRAQLQAWFERYTEPDRDGTKQAVTGRGQLDLIGKPDAFAQDVGFLRDG
ncbi:MAG: sulfatase-like hydrolase/transferase [Rhodospirillales bacterium]